jgi:hypothetical protein
VKSFCLLRWIDCAGSDREADPWTLLRTGNLGFTNEFVANVVGEALAIENAHQRPQKLL